MQLHPSLSTALDLLVRAHDCAADLGPDGDPWDLAVEIGRLRAAGLENSDLRWLALKGWVVHAEEITPAGADHRVFRAAGQLTIRPTTCVRLTAAGRTALRPRSAGPARGPVPRWDGSCRLLELGGRVIKQFRQKAESQEVVLSAFEEEGWPRRIDDPLPPREGLDVKRRLRDTIANLNRHQARSLLRFLGDGTGDGIRWEATARRPHGDS